MSELHKVKLSRNSLIWARIMTDYREYAPLNQKLDEKLYSFRAQILGSSIVKLTTGELNQLIKILKTRAKTDPPSSYRDDMAVLNELKKQGYI